MSDQTKAPEAAGAAGSAAKPVAKPVNPAFQMMGLPRLRAKLPSRNWLIFFTVVGSFSGAITYDRRQKRKIQQKWCNTVAHISDEALPTNTLPRKLTVFLSAPPGDGLRTAREHFQEYIKPILVAAAVDWDVVEGRKEGDVRAGLAERIREVRRKNGEQSSTPLPKDVIADVQKRFDTQQDTGPGDIVLGRHTWKEYIRGIHEGWLGPIDDPNAEPSLPEALSQEVPSPLTKTEGTEPSSPETSQSPPQSQSLQDTIDTISGEPVPGEGASTTQDETNKAEDDASPAAGSESKEAPAKEEPKPKPKLTPPYILPSEYQSATPAPSIPQNFAQSVVLPQPHLLGFLNTPIRIYRYLNQRHTAENTGRQVASLLLGGHQNLEYDLSSETSQNAADADEVLGPWEQQRILLDEEKDWHKSVRAPNPPEEEHKERPLMEGMVIDERVGSRMRKPEIVPDPAKAVHQDGTGPLAKSVNDGSQIGRHFREWKGGADPALQLTWWQWLKESFDVVDDEPTCKGWEHGNIDPEAGSDGA